MKVLKKIALLLMKKMIKKIMTARNAIYLCSFLNVDNWFEKEIIQLIGILVSIIIMKLILH